MMSRDVVSTARVEGQAHATRVARLVKPYSVIMSSFGALTRDAVWTVQSDCGQVTLSAAVALTCRATLDILHDHAIVEETAREYFRAVDAQMRNRAAILLRRVHGLAEIAGIDARPVLQSASVAGMHAGVSK